MKIISSNKSPIYTRILKYFLIYIVVFSFILPSTVKACSEPNDPCPKQSDGSTTKHSDGSTTKKSDGGVQISTGINNPLGNSVPDIQAFIALIINFVLLIGVPIVALAIIYSGFLFVTSLGNSEKLTKAKKVFIYTIIGAAILLGANVISHAIKGTVDCISDSNDKCK